MKNIHFKLFLMLFLISVLSFSADGFEENVDILTGESSAAGQTSASIDLNAYSSDTENIMVLRYGVLCGETIDSQGNSKKNPTYLDYIIAYDGSGTSGGYGPYAKLHNVINAGADSGIVSRDMADLLKRKYMRYEGQCNAVNFLAYAQFDPNYGSYNNGGIKSFPNNSITLDENGEVIVSAYKEYSTPIETLNIQWDSNKFNCEQLGGAYLPSGYNTGGAGRCCGDDFIWAANANNKKPPVTNDDLISLSLDPFDLSRENIEDVNSYFSEVPYYSRLKKLFENTLCLYQGAKDGIEHPEQEFTELSDENNFVFTCFPPEGHDEADGRLLDLFYENNENTTNRLLEVKNAVLHNLGKLSQIYDSEVILRDKFNYYPERKTDLGVYNSNNGPLACNYKNVNGTDQFMWELLDDRRTRLSESRDEISFEIHDSNQTYQLEYVQTVRLSLPRSWSETECKISGGSWTGNNCCGVLYDYEQNEWVDESFNDNGEGNGVCFEGTGYPNGEIVFNHELSEGEGAYVSYLNVDGQMHACYPSGSDNVPLAYALVHSFINLHKDTNNELLIPMDKRYSSCQTFEVENNQFVCDGSGQWREFTGEDELRQYTYPWSDQKYCSVGVEECSLPDGTSVSDGESYVVNGENYLCREGVWIGPVGKSMDWDYALEGTCAPEECFFNGEDVGVFELNNGCTQENNFYYKQHLCEKKSGEASYWTTRTKYAALALLELNQDENFTLYCDDFERALNNVDELKSLHIALKDEVQDLCVFKNSLGTTVAVPLTPSSYSTANTEFSFNNSLFMQRLIEEYDPTAPQDCNNVIEEDNRRTEGEIGVFKKCRNNGRYLFNNELKILIFNKERVLVTDILRFGEESILTNEANLIENIFDSNRVLNLNKIDPKLLTQFKDFSRLFFMKSGDKKIFATMENMGNSKHFPNLIKNVVLLYISGFTIDTSACDYFEDEVSTNEGDFTSYCKINSREDDVYVIGSMVDRNLPLWSSVTGTLRIEGES